MQGEVSYRVWQELQKFCSEPKPELPPYPEDEQEVEAIFDLLEALAHVWEAALHNPALPAPCAPCYNNL